MRNAYGRLALTLENKGIVTLAQSEDDAISAAAQARATQNGTSIEAERAKLSRAMMPSAARRLWVGSRTINDFLVPETPAYDGNTTGDLMVVPGGIGIPALPVRVKVGEAKGPHRGYGMMHMADNARQDARRMPRQETGDISEDLMRQAVNLLDGRVDVYHEGGNMYALVNRMEKQAVVLALHEGYYSVTTVRPVGSANPTQLWGDPVFRNGRLAFPSQTTAVAESPQSERQDNDVPRPDRTGQGVRTERFNITKPTGNAQDATTHRVNISMAKVYDRHAAQHQYLYHLQYLAKTAKRGLWSDVNPLPPWERCRAVRNQFKV